MKDSIKELFKEASDVIGELIQKVANIQNENENLRIELLQYKEASERERVAKLLEEKSLTSMAKIASLRNGTLDQKEYERLKYLADANLIDSNFENTRETKTAEDISESPIDAMERRRSERAELIYNNLQTILQR